MTRLTSQTSGQLQLAGIRPAPRPASHRGMEFERMLEAAHDFYLRARQGKVYKVPNAWAFCSEWEWRQTPADRRARDGRGRPLRRVRTPADFFGCVRGVAVAFDAKEFADASIPIEKNFHPHQVAALRAWERAGGLAGFMVWSRRSGRVYWIPASLMLQVTDAVRLNQFPRKSLPLDWLEAQAKIVCEARPGFSVDWAAALLPEEKSDARTEIRP